MEHKSKELQTAIVAAKLAATHALTYFDKSEKDLGIELKDNNTPVTIADRECEEIIKKHVLSVFPDAKLVREETGGDIMVDEYWTIDPIDGTRSFSRGVNGWAILIAYFADGQYQLGVCYFPVHDELLYAERGKGAYYNEKRVHVSTVDSVSKTYFGHGNPKHTTPEQRAALNRLIDAAGSVRSWEVTYANFLLAQGKVDIVFDEYAFPWDVAPYAVIIPEAGGKLTRLDGSPITREGKGYLSTNGLIHDEIIAILNQK